MISELSVNQSEMLRRDDTVHSSKVTNSIIQRPAQTGVDDTCHRLPKTLLQDKNSPDLFFVGTHDGLVELVASPHFGHQFFKSIAELSRVVFVDNFGKKENNFNVNRRIAHAICNTICEKGHGKIYFRLSNSSKWKDTGVGDEARTLVFEALKTLFGIKVHGVAPPAKHSSECKSVRSDSSEKRTTPPNRSLPPKKRVRFAPQRDVTSTVELSQTQTKNTEFLVPSSDVESTTTPPEGKVNEALVSTTESLTAARTILSSRTRVRIATKQQSSTQSPTRSRQARNNIGIPMRSIADTDVLCGGAGQAAFTTGNKGNQKFLALVDSHVNQFVKADKATKFSMAQRSVDLVLASKGRFLTLNLATGLFQEISKEKAWGKAYRTFVARFHKFVALTSQGRPTPQHQVFGVRIPAASPAFAIPIKKKCTKELDTITSQKLTLQDLLHTKEKVDPLAPALRQYAAKQG